MNYYSSRRIFDMLSIYAQLADQEFGLLEHFCDSGVQVEIDTLAQIIDFQEYFYDHEHPVSWNHIDWLSQFYGLGRIENHWLGIGLNPLWEIEHKIEVINSISNYWLTKGTENAQYEAVRLWLRFADRERLLIINPFGTNSSDNFLPLWWNDETRWDDHILKTYPERKNLAWGNYFGNYHLPSYFTLQSDYLWGYDEQWSDRFLIAVESVPTYESRSFMGDRDVNYHFYLNENEWNRVFPNIFGLIPESTPATQTTTVFGWLDDNHPCEGIVLEKAKEDIIYLLCIEPDGAWYGQIVWDGMVEDYEYGGLIWPYLGTSTTINKTIAEEFEFGVWEPELWDGDWFSYIPVMRPLAPIFLDYDLSIGADNYLFAPNSLEISREILLEADNLFIPGHGNWYLPWNTYTQQREVEEVVSSDICNQGIKYFGEIEDIFYIDMGIGLYEASNQYLVVDRDAQPVYSQVPLELEPPLFTSDDLFIEADLFGSLIEINDRIIQIITDFVDRFSLIPLYAANYFSQYISGLWYYRLFSLGIVSAIAEPFPNHPWLYANASEKLVAPGLDFPLIYRKGNFCNVFGQWPTMEADLEVKEIIPDPEDLNIYEMYPILADASDSNNWSLLVATEEEIYFLKPITSFWYADDECFNGRSSYFSFEKHHNRLYLEFLLEPKHDTKIESIALCLKDKIADYKNFYYKLNSPGKMQAGFVFQIPFVLPTCVDTPSEQLLLAQILPELNLAIRRLAKVEETDLLSVLSLRQRQSQLLQPLHECESIRNILTELRDLVRDAGDAHETHIISTPTTRVEISYEMPKEPSVTFVETIDSAGRLTIGDVIYLEPGSLIVEFSHPVTGRILLN